MNAEIQSFVRDCLARGIARVLDSASLRQRLTAAGRTQSAQFSWERTAAATLGVYRAVFAETHGRHRTDGNRTRSRKR